MPNKYTKKKIPQYKQEDIINAVQDVKNNKIPMYAAAKKYGIPSMTLYNKVKQTYSSNMVGRPLAIPWELEKRLADAIKLMEKWGFGLSRNEVLSIVTEFVVSNNLNTPFTSNKPGKDWFMSFRKRHSLSIKKPQPIEYVRKKMTDPFIIAEYFTLLENTLSELNIFQSPHLIFNMDETSLSLDPTKTKVVGAVNKPCSRTICGSGKENITVLTTVSAAGKKLSPLIVFKGKNVWDQWMATTENFDFELSYAASTKGWMETEIFYNFMKKIVIPALGGERPVLIIYDGHSTHVDTRVIELAVKNNVTILKLPPHTSHLLQPLDVAVFKSFKTKWDSKLVEWQRHNVGIKMPKKVFAQTFAETWQETNPDVIKSGFQKAGIYPFDSQVIPVDKYDPAAFERYKIQNAENLSFLGHEINAKNVTPLSALSKLDNQNQPFVAKSSLTLPKCLQSDHSQPTVMKQPKINIISNIKVNFEELLLEKIRQDKKDNTSVKKKRVAKGAEVITASINKNCLEQKKPQETTECVYWIQGTKDKVNSNQRIAKPGLSGIKKTKNKKQSKEQKRQKFDSNSSSTSISDIMSVYSEELTDEFFDEKEHDIVDNLKNDKLLRNMDKTQINKNKENSDNTEEETSSKDKKLTQGMNKDEIEGECDKKVGEYVLNDAVLVRYFSRKKWTYYIGFIKNVFKKNNENYYTVDFLKTIKQPILTFTQTKKKDCDEIPELLIVKKINLEKIKNTDMVFRLSDENNKIYF